jgi:hypothetical protein
MLELDRERNDEYLRNFSSDAPLNQLNSRTSVPMPLTDIQTIDDFMLYYKLPENNNKSFLDLFIESGVLLGNDSYRTTTTIIQTRIMQLSLFPEVGQVLVNWLSNKSKPSTLPPLKNNTKEEEKKEKQKDPEKHKARVELNNILKVFANTFWNIGKASQIQGFDASGPPAVVLQDLEGKVAGYYVQKTHIIVLDDSSFSAQMMKEFNDFFIRGKSTELEGGSISKNLVYTTLLQNELKTRTFIHELEHARRRQDCANSPHGKITNIFVNDVNVLYDFDEGATAVYCHILSRNLFGKLFATLRS